MLNLIKLGITMFTIIILLTVLDIICKKQKVYLIEITQIKRYNV